MTKPWSEIKHKPEDTCQHGKKTNEECNECCGGFDGASPQITKQQYPAYPIVISEHDIEQQKIVNGIVNARLDAAMPHTKEEIDFNELRNLLFSIRDQGIYCPMCRCPEFSPSPEMRTSHFEDCTVGLMCEKLLWLYPREGYVVKWRK